MSTFKKVISIVLCFSLLAGSFAFLGDLIVPKASAAAGESHITKTYDELADAYDNFIYLGIDVYEVKNGELTDGYVQAGDWLEYRMTVLSDMYIGQSYPIMVYDNDFFDVHSVSSMTESTSYESNVTTDLLNHDHPSYESGWSTLTVTVTPCNTLNAYTKGTMGIDATFYDGWDQVKLQFKMDTTSRDEPFVLKEDTWWINWYARVSTKAKENDTGMSQSRYDLYRSRVPFTQNEDGTCTTTDYKPASVIGGALGDFTTADWTDDMPTSSACKAATAAPTGSTVKRWQAINYFNLDDTVHTFTIGDAPTGPAVEKKTVTFLENDGTTLPETTEYAPGEPVTVPAAVADQYGWADVSTGNVVTDLADGFAMLEKNITYKRVLTTDKFDITVNLDGGSVADASLLPEGTTVNEDGSVTVKAPINTEINLNEAVPAEALSKPGYKAAEWTSAAKIENINGIKVKVSWVADTFNVTFYNSQDDYENGNILYETTVGYNATTGYTDITKGNTNADVAQKFAGWVDAETGVLVSTTASLGKYTYTEDKSFYATWTDKAYTITLMVRDYENGGWKTFAAKYADNGNLALNTIKTAVENAGLTYYAVSSSGDEFVKINEAIAYDADKTVYVYTRAAVSVTWQVPVFDAETGELTDSYNTETVTKDTGATVNPFMAEVKTTLSTDAHTGYKFAGWFDENGNSVSYDSAIGAKFNTVDGLERTITAKYELVEYTIKFDLKNGSMPNTYAIEGTYNVGDEIDFANAKIINTETGNEAYLPTIGLENKEQPNGTYRGVNGYKFVSWSVISGDTWNEVDITTPVTLTADVINIYSSNDTITLYGTWEGLYYDLVFNYQTGTDAEGNPVYTAMDPMKVQTGDGLPKHEAVAAEIAKANLPEGKTFVGWRYEGTSSAITKMPAYGATAYATYSTNSISVYIDYNHGTEENPLTTEDTVRLYLGEKCYYGLDVDAVPEATELVIDPRSFSNNIMNSTLTSKPGDAYECVGWKIYHVPADKDYMDKANWVEGVNDDGTSIAKTTLIYQVQWKAHSEFFFRIYDTDHGISRALGKNFKMYYWYNGFVRDKNTVGELNKYPDTNIILFFTLELENWEWSRFFDISMWQSLTLKVEPYDINKSALNPKNFILLLQALFKGIGSGFGSEEEVVE